MVANEAVWPARTGGTVRITGLVRSLCAAVPTVLAEPELGEDAPFPLRRVRLQGPRPSKLAAVLGRRPRIGSRSIGRIAAADLEAAIGGRPGVVLFMHSYLAPMVTRPPGAPVVIDFADVETERQQSLAASGRGVEALLARIEAHKASRWEPRVAGEADLVVAVNAADASVLEQWSKHVIVVPNAADGGPTGPSPSNGRIGVLANARHAPNVQGLQWLLDEVWPKVIARTEGEVHLVIAGRGTAEHFSSDARRRVEVVGEVDDAMAFYDACALVAAPVQSGGGTQVKLVEALSRRRLVVATSYGARSVPVDASAAVEVADDADAFANALATLCTDDASRHAREAALPDDLVPTWAKACAPLVAAVVELMDRSKAR